MTKRRDFEAILAREGLAPLDDGIRGHRMSNRGSTFSVSAPKREMRADDIDGRSVVLSEHRFRTRFQRVVWRRHCLGLSVTEIASELGEHRSRVHRAIVNVRSEWQASKAAPDLYALAKVCDKGLMSTILRAMRYAQKFPEESDAAIEEAEALLGL